MIRCFVLTITLGLICGATGQAGVIQSCTSLDVDLTDGTVNSGDCIAYKVTANFEPMHATYFEISDPSSISSHFSPGSLALLYHGEINEQENFIVTGGSGTGRLVGSLDQFSDGRFEGQPTEGQFGSINWKDDFQSNFLPAWPGPFSVVVPFSFEFTFNQPFTWFVRHRIDLGLANVQSAAYRTTIKFDLNITSIVDSNGLVVPGAVMSTAIPEPSCLPLMALALVAISVLGVKSRRCRA